VILLAKDSDLIRAKVVDIELERSKLDREMSLLVLNKALVFYFIFIIVAIFGFVNGMMSKMLFNIMVVVGLGVFVIGAIPYITTMRKEEKTLNRLVKELKR
jgi:hypothetical protein